MLRDLRAKHRSSSNQALFLTSHWQPWPPCAWGTLWWFDESTQNRNETRSKHYNEWCQCRLQFRFTVGTPGIGRESCWQKGQTGSRCLEKAHRTVSLSQGELRSDWNRQSHQTSIFFRLRYTPPSLNLGKMMQNMRIMMYQHTFRMKIQQLEALTLVPACKPGKNAKRLLVYSRHVSNLHHWSCPSMWVSTFCMFKFQNSLQEDTSTIFHWWMRMNTYWTSDFSNVPWKRCPCSRTCSSSCNMEAGVEFM